MRATQRRSQETHRTPPGESRVKSFVRAHGKEPGIVNTTSIPARNTDDAYGNPFLGLPGNRLEVNAVGNTELGPDAVLNGNIGEQINAIKLPNLAGITGNLPGSRISGNIDVSNLPLNIPANNVPNIQNLNGVLPIGQTEGTLGAGRVPGLGKLNGKIKAHSQIDWGNGAPPVPAGKVSKGYHYDKLEGRPNLKKFLTRSDFRTDGTLKR